MKIDLRATSHYKQSNRSAVTNSQISIMSFSTPQFNGIKTYGNSVSSLSLSEPEESMHFKNLNNWINGSSKESLYISKKQYFSCNSIPDLLSPLSEPPRKTIITPNDIMYINDSEIIHSNSKEECTTITVCKDSILEEEEKKESDAPTDLLTDDFALDQSPSEHLINSAFNHPNSEIEKTTIASSDHDYSNLKNGLSHAINPFIANSEKGDSDQWDSNVVANSNVVDKDDIAPKVGLSTEASDDLPSLRAQVEDLLSRLMSSQEQIESLLEEKSRWLTSVQQRAPISTAQKPGVSADTAAIVVKFAQSEQRRLKAEARVKELEETAARLRTEGTSPGRSGCNTVESNTVKELNKALIDAREKAEHLRHTLKQEGIRVYDLTTQLNTTREAHRREQKRSAGQIELIEKLNREISSLKQQVKDANKVKEREAKRLCDEIVVRETTEKYNKALADLSVLQDRIAHFEEGQRSKVALEERFAELQRAHDDLVAVRQEVETSEKRESELSEFTRRLTERNAALQADYLAVQARLQSREWALAEADSAAREASALARATEERLRGEVESAAGVIATLEARVSELSQTELAAKTELARERTEKCALKRKQQALSRELGRLMYQQKKHLDQVSTAVTTTGTMLIETASQCKLSLTDSTPSLPFTSEPSPILRPHSSHSSRLSTPPLPVLGDALLANPEDAELASEESGSPLRETGDGRQHTVPEIQTAEPSRALLLNKIDRLQRTNVRLLEKIDFMYDHVRQLTLELQKKSQIIQHYCIRNFDENEGCGTTEPSSVDFNKHQRMRPGSSLMATIFSGDHVVDASTDLRSSLQVNRQLQSVLEDTLYKNFTLKESIDTLADEASRLKRANRELKDLVSNQPIPFSKRQDDDDDRCVRT